jgi:hypothetical protein
MSIAVGDQVRVSGGYDFEPQWLGNREFVSGVVLKWIPGQNETPGCVISLDEALTAEGDVHGVRETRTGSFLVLSTRYVGQVWEDSGTVHVELCTSEPEDAAWSDRPVGAWVESHATYTKA